MFLTHFASAERIDAGHAPACVGESPVWRMDEGALYWVDIPARRIVRQHLDTGTRTEWTLPEQVACFAFYGSTGCHADGASRLVAGLESGLFSVELAQPQGEASAPTWAHRLAAPHFPAEGMRFNDGRCDRQGRFWAGTMVQAGGPGRALGALYRLDARGGLSGPVVDGLIVQNGLAWSPDGATMYLSDSHASRRLVWAFDYDIPTGTPSRRRVFADLNEHMGRPDGAAVDADGCYWVCANDAGAVLRFTPLGRLDRILAVPVAKPSMCAFGGPGLDTLFVTSIRPADGAGEHDGHVFALRPGVRGLPEPGYAGAP